MAEPKRPARKQTLSKKKKLSGKPTRKSKAKSTSPLRPDFFRSIIEASVSPMFVLDLQHRVVLWNRACENLTGIRADEVIGTNKHWKAFYSQKRYTLADFIIDGDFSTLDKSFEMYSASDVSISSEGFFPKVGGNPCYLLFDASPIFDDEGNLVAAVETLRDITPRKEAEEALLGAMERFNTVLDSLDMIVYVADMETYELLYLNEHAKKLFGDGVGKHCYEVLHEHMSGPCEFCTNKNILGANGKPTGIYVWEFQNANNGQWYDIHDQAIRWVDGRFVRLEIANEITARKKAEEELYRHRELLSELVQERTAALRSVNESLQGEIARHKKTEKVLIESEERFRSIYAESPIGIEIYNAKGRLFDANPACLDIFGVTDVQEIKGFSLFHDPNVSEDIKERVKNGEIVRFEASFDFERVRELGLYHTQKSGTAYLDVLISPLGITGGRGAAIGYLVQLQDVTEQKRLEGQLRHAQKMEAVGQLAGGIAHDFNNIISAISNFAYLLSIKMPSENPLREYVQRIMASSERAANLTHSLLGFSRKQVLNPRPVELNGIIQGIEKLLHRLIGEDIVLSVFLEPMPLPLMADSHQIEQVLMNLCTNARDAMPDGGQLNIVTRREEREHPSKSSENMYALLSVTDSGRGMDEKTKNNIFEPFFTTKEVGKGTGLGLSIVYSTVSQHGGFIEVFTAPGKGTTFKIYFPLLLGQIKSDEKETQPIPKGQGEKILLAEDDDEVRTVISDILSGFGYEVIEASNGQEAVREFKRHFHNGGVHLLVLDVLMPKKNGRDAYSEIRKVDPTAKVLFLSGYTADILQRKRVLDEGFSLLSKPFAPDQVLRRIRELIDS